MNFSSINNTPFKSTIGDQYFHDITRFLVKYLMMSSEYINPLIENSITIQLILKVNLSTILSLDLISVVSNLCSSPTFLYIFSDIIIYSNWILITLLRLLG